MAAAAAIFVLAGRLSCGAEIAAVLLAAATDVAFLAFASTMFTGHETSFE
jgi:hypothetical protein